MIFDSSFFVSTFFILSHCANTFHTVKLVFYLFYSFSFHFVCSLFILISFYFYFFVLLVVVAVETRILYKLHFAQQRTWVHVFLCWTQLRIEHVFQFTCARRMTSFLFLHLLLVCESFLCYEKSTKCLFTLQSFVRCAHETSSCAIQLLAIFNFHCVLLELR